MHPTRRRFLALAGLAASTGFIRPVRAADASPLPDMGYLMGPRTLGSPTAPIVVEEFFSLTCTHCARFSNEVLPQITDALVTPGKVRFVYHDYPLDQVAMTACMVARALPVERYELFCAALFADQNAWAFAPDGGNSTEALAREALLAGLSRARFDAVVADDALRQAIAAQQQKDTDQFKIDATPTFRYNGKQHSGELSFQEFLTFTGAKA